jgi:hypothetical protein
MKWESSFTPDRWYRDRGLVPLLIAVAAWGSWLIARTSFVVEGRRWFTLFDDPMISMTYVRNWIEGHGFRWARQGAPVEGFSDPLWMVAMLPSHLLPLDPRWRSLPVQILSLVTLLGAVLVIRRLMLDHFAAPGVASWLPAAVLTAFYYPLAYWAVMGMETGLEALLTLLCVKLALDAVYLGRDRHLALWLVCAAAYLLRMDLLVVVVAAQAFMIGSGGLRRAGVRTWLGGLAGFLLLAGGYELFRWSYFHDLLPNTYYLKLTGIPFGARLLRGWSCVCAFARAHGVLFAAVLVGSVPLLRRDRRLLLPLGVVALQTLYTIWIGGDAWEGDWPGALPIRADRFLAFVMPLVFVAFNAELNAVLSAWRARPHRATIAATVLGLIAANGLWPGTGVEQGRLLLGIERPPITRRHAAVIAHLLRFERVVAPDAVVATVWAGIPAYFSDYRMIDLLGFNDRELARMPSTIAIDAAHFQRFVPGHVKWDVRRALEIDRPDAFFQTWEVRELGRPARIMRLHGYRLLRGFWVRADSPAVIDTAATRRRRERGHE